MSDTKVTTPERRKFLIEHVMQVAERRADQAVAAHKPEVVPDADCMTDDRQLVSQAMEELDRHAARARFLPASLFSDTGWIILLRIFVSEYRGAALPEPESCDHWNVGQETTIRHIAGLIALGLIERVRSSEHDASLVLTLTVHGRENLRKALRLEF